MFSIESSVDEGTSASIILVCPEGDLYVMTKFAPTSVSDFGANLIWLKRLNTNANEENYMFCAAQRQMPMKRITCSAPTNAKRDTNA